MNKKEINEIKGLLSIEECNIIRLRGCYVDGDKNKVTRIDERFLNLAEEEQHKYLEIFRKCFSGTPGRNLIDMTFSKAACSDKGARDLLLKIRESELQNDELLEILYDKIIATYDFVGNYLILIFNQIYDIPTITEDNISMDDASEDVYNYMLCCICPVNLSKAGLSYDEEHNVFHNIERSHIVDMPQIGVLFPAFNMRSEDIDSILLYTKSTDEFPDEMINEVLDCHIPMPANTQKETFQTIVAETLGDSCDYNTIKTVHENLNELIEEKKGMPNAGIIDKKEVRQIFERSGVDDERIADFDKNYDSHFENNTETPAVLAVSNLSPGRKFEVKTPDVVVKINSDKTDLVETREIDGNNYLLIRIDEGLVVNGIPVK